MIEFRAARAEVAQPPPSCGARCRIPAPKSSTEAERQRREQAQREARERAEREKAQQERQRPSA
ncbi:hypothetical protein [Escherichia coli]|uniref:hypothetical protein n=1 Tax=Escherichia coli TaxID=562 RepID=UPI00388ECD4D